MASDYIPGFAMLLTNHENRLNQIEYELAKLQGRMPKSKVRQLFWWVSSMFWIAIPIIGGLASLLGEEPWKEPVVFVAFGALIGKALSNFATIVGQGPRSHKSLLIEDHR